MGLIERLAVAGRYALTGQLPDGANWFGPGEPLAPMAPEAVAGRRLDFRPGQNLDTKPRDGEGVEFRHLRALADNCGLVRLVIETRKDQLGWREFEIRPKKGMGASADDPDIKKIAGFLEYPDREHDWETWLRAMVEEMLVPDATTIYPRRARSGELYSLDLIAGDTIKCIIDPWGRRPLPPEAAYQQILHGSPAVDYAADQLLYLPRNYRANKIYGFSPVEQIIVMVNIALRRDMHKLQFYTEGTVPDALAGVPLDWNTAQIQEFQDYFDSLLEGNTAQRRKIRFVPETIAKAFVATKAEALKDDFDEFLARFVCYAFSVSSQWAVKMMNRSTAESAAQQATEEGLAPLQSWVKRVMTRIIALVFGRPDLEFAWQEDKAVDPAEQSVIEDRALRNASATINQIRAARGEDPVEGGDEPLIYTTTGVITLKNALKPPEPTPAPLGHNGGPALDDAPPEAKGKPMQKAAGDEPPDMKDLWAAHLKDQGEKVAAYLTAVTGDSSPASLDAVTVAASAVDAATTAAERHSLAAVVTEILLDAATTGIQDGVAELVSAVENGSAEAGIVLGPREAVEITNLAHPGAVEYATSRSAALVSKIDETTRVQLRDLITKAQQEGWSTAKLADQVEAMGGFGPVRADMIARTELAAASIRGNLASWIAARDRLGIMLKKRVILGINEQHCQACADAVREGAIPLEESWNVGYAPPFHPRCGCDLVPVTESDEEGPRASSPFDRMEKAGGNPWHDHLGRFACAPETGGGGGSYDADVEIARGHSALRAAVSGQMDVYDAMAMPGVGAVSFVWGDPGDVSRDYAGGYGLAKIVGKHGMAAAENIPVTLARGHQEAAPGRLVVRHEGHRVILTQGGKGAPGHWVLSAYEEGKASR